MKNIVVDLNLPIMPIGAIANALGIHQRTLRIYDKEGILSPSRTEKNRRYYTLNDVEKGRLILYLTRNLALNITGVKFVLTMLNEAKVKPENSLEYVKTITKKAKISQDELDNNLEKASKKGRKTS